MCRHHAVKSFKQPVLTTRHFDPMRFRTRPDNVSALFLIYFGWQLVGSLPAWHKQVERLIQQIVEADCLIFYYCWYLLLSDLLGSQKA